jgi:hypothetical protein
VIDDNITLHEMRASPAFAQPTGSLKYYGLVFLLR